MQKSALILGMLLTAATAQADRFGGDCDHKAQRRIATPAAGVQRIVVIGRAGSLRVEGRSGVAEVVASGTACSSDADFLKSMDLVARRTGSELRIEAVIPEKKSGWFGNWSAGLDFAVIVPAGVAIDIEDGSGATEIANVGSARVVDGSGELNIRGVNGNLRVTDGSGHVSIANVSGNVEIEDGSGSIDISDVRRDVLVEDDGSGSIDVERVGGNFTVRDDGSGGISYRNVTGRVQVPADSRARR